MEVSLNNKTYILLSDYQNSDIHRKAFDALAKKIFGISFEEWYQARYWNEKYIPYTLFDGDRAVSNVSVNIMDFNTLGVQQRYIQLGTSLTDDEYRNQGLNNFLMEKVIEEWNGKCEFIYLYAHKRVLDRYPKFGFSIVKEYEYFKPVEKVIKHDNFEKLNMNIQANRDKLYDYAKNSQAFAKLSLKENADLVMFYCTSNLKENIYFIKSLDVIVVAIFDKNQLRLWDVFGKTKVDLDKIISFLATPQISEVVLGFTPEDCSTYEVREYLGDDTLFIQHGKTELLDKNKLMFPLLSHA